MDEEKDINQLFRELKEETKSVDFWLAAAKGGVVVSILATIIVFIINIIVAFSMVASSGKFGDGAIVFSAVFAFVMTGLTTHFAPVIWKKMLPEDLDKIHGFYLGSYLLVGICIFIVYNWVL